MIATYSTRQLEPDITVIELAGQLSLGNRLMDIEHAIKGHIEKGSRKLIMDMTKLTFLDSAGIGMVMLCSGTMKQGGGKLLIAGAEGRVKQVLELTHIHHVIGMYPDLDSARAALDGHAAEPPAS